MIRRSQFLWVVSMLSVLSMPLALPLAAHAENEIESADDWAPSIEVHELTDEQLHAMGLSDKNFPNMVWSIPTGEIPTTTPTGAPTTTATGGNPPPCPKGTTPTPPGTLPTHGNPNANPGPLGPLGIVQTQSGCTPAQSGAPGQTGQTPGQNPGSTTGPQNPLPGGGGLPIPDPVPTDGTLLGKIGSGVVILEHIVNIGKDVWQFIRDGRPVVTMDMPTASALPQGVTAASQLGGWEPKTKNYKVIIPGDRKGRSEFVFRLTFWHSGNARGVGHYIANLAVQAADYKVNWGQNFSVRARIPAEGIVNVSHDEHDPIAGMQVLVEWSRGKVWSTQGDSAVIYVRGDGETKNLSAPDEDPEDIYPIGKDAGSRPRR